MALLSNIKRRIPGGKFYWREILSLFFILVGFYFFRKERGELQQVTTVLLNVHAWWIVYGIILAIIYIAMQSAMYVTSFLAVNSRITFISAVELYLKRNLIGIFLPAGGVTSQTFFKSIVEKQQVSNTKTNFASYLFVITGILSVVIIAIPVIFYLSLVKGIVGQELYYFLGLLLLMSLIIWASFSVYKKGWCYHFILKISPQFEVIFQEILAEKINGKRVIQTLLISVGVEVIGIAQLYVAMRAVAPDVSMTAAFLGYSVATIFLIISPFLKGIGAIELALVYILTLYGYNTAVAASITLLYRFFNFWLQVLAGLVSFLFNRGNLLLRLFPAFFTFLLGLVNLISGLSPAIHWRMRLIEEFLPISTIHASNDFVIAAGVVLIVISAFLLRGLQSAWVLALVVSLLSCVAHFIKAIDYEEAIFAILVVIILIATRRQYYVKSSLKLINAGIKVAVLALVTGIAFGIIGFYFLDKKQFGVNLDFFQSFKYTLQNFLLLDTDLVPHTKFASGFLRVINVMGVFSIGFLFYTLIRPFVFKVEDNMPELEKARELVNKYGRSAAEYFKVYPDKLIFFGKEQQGFISYKIANDFAIALGEPVCADEETVKLALIDDFEIFCNEHGLKSAYYRIDEERLPLFEKHKKKFLSIGQEAIIDVMNFSMEGKSRQNLRTAKNTLQKKGYTIQVIDPPIPGNILQQLKAVSNDWLDKLKKEEIVFSQGMFLEDEIRQHIILALQAPDQSIVAFLNLVPDYQPGEVRYDLIRKLAHAPSTCMDFLMVALIEFCQARGYHSINMGMAPMSGIDTPKGLRERTIKFAYEKIKRFQHYRGLRNFKEKFDPVWENKYLVYDHHFDLLLLPAALNKVMKEF
jgi:phosphatidylglycerol lysyltransferase